jgi:type II secretory pathway component PulF
MSSELGITLKLLGTLIGKRMPLIEALEKTASACRKPQLQEAWRRAGKRLRQGATPAEAFHPESASFPPGFTALLEAGERSGNLGSILVHAGNHEEALSALKESVRRSFIPCLTAMTASLLFGALWILRIEPQFADSYSAFLASRPWYLSPFMPVIWIVPALALIYILLRLTLTSQIPGVFRNLKKIVWTADWINRLAIFLKAGVPLHTAVGHLDTDELDCIASALEEGQSLGETLKGVDRMPASIRSLLDHGEKSGRLPELASLAGSFYDRAVRTHVRIAANRTAIFTFLMTGLIIAIAVISAYYAYFDLLGNAAKWVMR